MNRNYKNIVDFKSIPESRKKLGLKLIKRVSDYALYVTDCSSFEIHKIRVKENVTNPWTKTLYNKIELIAGKENFGTQAWCYERLSTVFRYFGFFAEYVDYILEKLHQLGYQEIQPTMKNQVELGYIF